MLTAIIIATITGMCTCIGSLSANLIIHSKTLWRLEQLERKTDKHNNLIERMFLAEGDIKTLREHDTDVDRRLLRLEAALKKE